MTRALNVTAGLIYLAWLVIGGLHASAGPRSETARPRPVLAGNLH
ncbi:hypothetical protein [uncultured Alsobacter sp.]|nr:hypothetical protein [uncultured Alsobacter sp.]